MLFIIVSFFLLVSGNPAKDLLDDLEFYHSLSECRNLENPCLNLVKEAYRFVDTFKIIFPITTTKLLSL